MSLPRDRAWEEMAAGANSDDDEPETSKTALKSHARKMVLATPTGSTSRQSTWGTLRAKGQLNLVGGYPLFPRHHS